MLSIQGSMGPGNPRDVPGCLVFRDPWVQHTIRKSWGCPGNPGILSIQRSWGSSTLSGNPGDIPGNPWVQHYQGILGTSRESRDT